MSPARGAPGEGPLRILVVDDSAADRLAAVRALRRGLGAVDIEEVDAPEAWERALAEDRFDIAIIDYRVGWTDGTEMLRTLKARLPDVPVIMLTATAEESTAMELVRQGLDEYLGKTPENYAFLPRSVRFALERARQRRALRESEEMLRLVIEGAADYAIFAVDPEGRIVSWNSGAERITGWREAEVLGRDHSQLLLPEEEARALGNREREAALREGVFHAEGWRQRKDGTRFWAEVTMRPQYDAAGALRGFTKVLRDITDRRRAEEEREALLASLEAERRRLAVVLDSLPVGVVLAEAPHGRLVQYNRQVEEVLHHAFIDTAEVADYVRWRASRLDGTPLEPGEYSLARALRGETVHSEVVRYAFGDGTTGFVEASAAPLRNAAGEVVAAVLVIRDVTERIAAEEEQRRTAEFRERLLGIVSHDLRSPLQALLLSAQTLVRNPALPEGAVRTAQRMVANVERMARMIADLLDFTRGRLGGGIPVEPEPLDLFALVREVAEEQLVAHPGARLTFEVAGDGHGTFDADRMAQVVANLLGNALRYGAPGEPVHLWLRGEGERVELRVSNPGPPIPPSLLPVIFEPFRREPTEREPRAARGLGLGLYIVQQVVQAHGGTISVTSTAGEGTTFTVVLPRHAQPRR